LPPYVGVVAEMGHSVPSYGVVDQRAQEVIPVAGDRVMGNAAGGRSPARLGKIHVANLLTVVIGVGRDPVGRHLLQQEAEEAFGIDSTAQGEQNGSVPER